MKLISKQMGILAMLYFIVTLLTKKYIFEDEIDNKAIFTTLASTIIFCLIFYFLKRKKNTSKDN